MPFLCEYHGVSWATMDFAVENKQNNPVADHAYALRELRAGDARGAELRLRTLQSAAPHDIERSRLLAVALLMQDNASEALDALERLLVEAPEFLQARIDLARACRKVQRADRAYTELRRVLRQDPSLHLAWLALGDVLVDLRGYADARQAFRRAYATDPGSDCLTRGYAAFGRGESMEAERLFREIIEADASHVGALCGLAAIYRGAGLLIEAERLLLHALRQTEHSPLVWRGMAQTLVEAGRLTEAEAAVRRALLVEPDSARCWVSLATISGRMHRPEAALAAYREAERVDPNHPLVHLSIGHVLKTLGRRAECEQAYHECIARDLAAGEAYVSLAELKNYLFTASQIAEMEAQLAAGPGGDTNAARLRFALGRAYEQRGDAPTAFAHYVSGNRLRGRESPFDFAEFEMQCRRVISSLDKDFFTAAARGGGGCTDPSPIFIVGLPRSGSTLVEQILSSHPAVEGTMELPNIPAYVAELQHLNARQDAYPDSLAAAPAAVLTALGRRYLRETAALRSGRRHFTDKLPNNFVHVGLIHAILPHATIIDVRRHPMDACLSCFKQYFAAGQSFTYDLEGLGRYYRSYLALMDHWDAVLPGKVLHVSYEELVREPHDQIRRLLAHCGLEFDARCLEFHQTQRPIRTASSEQVRQPLYTSGIGYWRRFERELQPLRASLGDCLMRFSRIEDNPAQTKPRPQR
jgi:tetratricopeptide (TPR) repeat protein